MQICLYDLFDMQCLCLMHWNLRRSVMRGLSFSDVLYYMYFAQCIMLHSVRPFCFSANTCGSFSSIWSCGDVFSVTASKRMQRLHFKLLADFTNATNLVNKMQQDARAHHSPSFRACQVTGTFCNLWFCSVCFGVCVWKSLKFAHPLQADKRAHHNALERKRRDHIKDSFHGLRDSVPALQGEKVSESVSWSDFVKQALVGLESTLSPNRAAKQTSQRVCVYSAVPLTSLNTVLFLLHIRSTLWNLLRSFWLSVSTSYVHFGRRMHSATANSQQVHIQ